MSDSKSFNSYQSTLCSPFPSSKHPQHPVHILSIEGNIGVGKSTFLKLLSQHLNTKFQLIDEPIDQWQTIKQGDQNLLDLFYKDPQRWGYTFQSFAFFTRIMHWQNIKNQVKYYQTSSHEQTNLHIHNIIDAINDNSNQINSKSHHNHNEDQHRTQTNIQNDVQQTDDSRLFISERSIYSDKFIFANNSHECNFMNDAEMLIYDHWFNYLTKQYDNDLDGIIYLRTTPEICLQRCQKRNRSEETTIQLDYLKMLNDKHDQWLIDNKKHNVLVLDVSGDIIDDKQFQQSVLNKVQEFISNIKNRKNN